MHIPFLKETVQLLLESGACSVGDTGSSGEILHSDSIEGREWICTRCTKYDVLLCDRIQFEPVVRRRRFGTEPERNLIAQKRIYDLARSGNITLYPDILILLSFQKTTYHVRNKMLWQRLCVHETDQAVAVKVDMARSGLGLFAGKKDIFCVWQEDLAFFCKNKGAPFAAEQRETEFFFQFPDSLGERRLGNHQFSG